LSKHPRNIAPLASRLNHDGLRSLDLCRLKMMNKNPIDGKVEGE
jgi:hypothetical protein